MSQNNSNLELVTFQIDNPVIKPDLIVLEAHPFPVVHRVNGTLCYFKYIGNKFLVWDHYTGCVWPVYLLSHMDLSKPTTFELASYDGECDPLLTEKENNKKTPL